jgi:hypothetical protein
MATPANAVLDVAGNTVTVGQISIVATTTFAVDLNGTSGTGKIVFDNGGSNATWDVENDGAAKQAVTTKGTANFVLSDNLVITSRSTQQFRPTGLLTDAPGESHSVTYTSDPETVNKELILTIAARKDAVFTGGAPATSALVDGVAYVIEGSLDLLGFATGVTPVAPILTGLPSDVWADYDYFSFSLDGSNGLTSNGFLRAGVVP